MIKPDLKTICDTEVHCTFCRRTDKEGHDFRVSIAQAFTCPQDWPECSFGKEWESKTVVESIPSKPLCLYLVRAGCCVPDTCSARGGLEIDPSVCETCTVIEDSENLTKGKKENETD